MRSLLPTVRGSQPMVLAIAAAFLAAGLVLYFQHRALSALDTQTGVILRQIAEQAAGDIAAEARRTLDRPVFETLTAVNHPELRAGRLDLVAREFDEGLTAFPHVERFFVWSAETHKHAPGEALFYERDRRSDGNRVRAGPEELFTRDPPLGQAILQVAERHAPVQHIYAVDDDVGPDRRAVFLRLFWTDARRVEYFAILGFVIETATAGQRLFVALHERKLGALLEQRGHGVPLQFRVTDEHGALVYGEPARAAESATATTTLPMSFFPVDRIDSRLSNLIPARPWHIEVTAPSGNGILRVSQRYWPTAVSALLMLVALALTVLANRRAQDLTRMQADFISHVSHQLKTPLSLLSAAMETVDMDRAKSPEKLAQYLGIIRGEVARLSALVQRILEYSRLQQPRRYEFEPVDLHALVHETVSAFESSLSARQFQFQVEEQGPLAIIAADPAAIEQALVNLLDNAVKYSGAARQVIVRLRSSSHAAFIEIVDRGVGIDKADLEHIFDRFYRGSGAAVHREGFGLGLPIVQELVRAHGGRVEVESTPGQGSTFRLVLPANLADRFEPAETPVRDPHGSEALP